jgi:hypothetical protein
MTDGIRDDQESRVLLKVLTAHYHALAAARSDETVLKHYAALLRFLKSNYSYLLEKGRVKRPGTELSRSSHTISEDRLRKVSLSDLDKIVSDEKTPRKDLEFIAIQRFSVPRGSMRSFSNKQMLIDKLRTLIGNERAHETIGAVARGQAREKPGW